MDLWGAPSYEHFYDYRAENADGTSPAPPVKSKTLDEIRRDYFRGIWTFLHHVSFQYPDEPTVDDIQNAKTLLRTVATPTVLKCNVCIQHFRQHLDNMPARTLYSRTHFSQWLVDVHNDVNARQDKPYIPYAEVKKMYLGKYASALGGISSEHGVPQTPPIGCPTKKFSGSSSDSDSDDDEGTCHASASPPTTLDVANERGESTASGASTNGPWGEVDADKARKMGMIVLGTLLVGVAGAKVMAHRPRGSKSKSNSKSE